MVEGPFEEGDAALVLQHPFVWSTADAEEEQGVQSAEPVVTVDGVFGRGELVHRCLAHHRLGVGRGGGVRDVARPGNDSDEGDGDKGDEAGGERGRCCRCTY